MKEEITSQSFSVDKVRAVVLGAGLSGLAASELLAKRGAFVTLSDTRETIDESGLMDGIEVEVDGHRQETVERAELIVLSPGVSPKLSVLEAPRKNGVPIISEVELASRWISGRIVAVTGTKGKSTTSYLVDRIFKEDGKRSILGGNVGVALSSQVEQSNSDVIHVVEVSSFQLELTTTFHPWISVFLNLSCDHLDRHEHFGEYASAKAKIFSNQTSSDVMVVNADDPKVLELASKGQARTVFFSLHSSITEGVSLLENSIVYRSGEETERLLPAVPMNLPGRHILNDVLAAVAVGKIAGVSPDALKRAVSSFRGLEHILEHVGQFSTVQFVNDSKATNIMAAKASIESFKENLVVIMGGRFKGGELTDLVPALTSKVIALIVIGEARDRFESELSVFVDIRKVEGMHEAVRLAFSLIKPKGVVLLAPACSSLDMFKDYRERGCMFKKEVKSLLGQL